MTRRLRTMAILVIAAALLLPATVLGQQRSTLVVVAGMWSPPNNFNPINCDSSYGYYAIKFIFSTLMDARLDDNQLKFAPGLASRWEASADNRTFTFTIHPRAAWHDGRPVTAEDVQFTVNTIADPKAETNRGRPATRTPLISTVAGAICPGEGGTSFERPLVVPNQRVPS